MNDLNLRVPPHSDEAEVCVLSAILERNSLLDDLESLVRTDDFYRRENQLIYRRMNAMSMVSQPIDPVTLCDSLESAGEADEVSPEYIVDIATNGRGSHNAIHYAKIIRDKSVARRLIAKGHEIAEIGYGDGESAEKLDKAQSLIMAETEEAGGETESSAEVLNRLVAKLDYLHKNAGKLTGVPTGFVDLDNLTNGLHDGEMIVLAGRPAMGKSTIAMNIAEHAAVKEGKTVLVFSLEMPADQIMMKSVCSVMGLDFDRVRKGKLEDAEWSGITAGYAKLKDASLFINDRSSLTSEQLLSRARKLQKRIGRKVDLIIVDYLQLMTDRGEGVERVTKISRNIKLTAKEMDCPVIAISQLSRKVEERGNKRPVNSDLRDSGAIEQDADIIGFIYRDEVYNPNTTKMKGVAELGITKHRNGETGTVYLTSQLHHCRFKDNIGYIPPSEPIQSYKKGFSG